MFTTDPGESIQPSFELLGVSYGETPLHPY